jgi:hypothetical protein
MADQIPISGLPPVTIPLLTDIIPVVQGGVTKRVTIGEELVAANVVTSTGGVIGNLLIPVFDNSSIVLTPSSLALNDTLLIFPDNTIDGFVIQDSASNVYVRFNSVSQSLTYFQPVAFTDDVQVSKPLIFSDATTLVMNSSNSFDAIFNLTADTNVIFPTSGTLATTSQLPSIVAANTLYVDGSAGNDTTGTGTSINPYATVSKALSVITTANASNLFNIRFQGFVLETTLALKPWVNITGNGWISSQLVISGGGNITLNSSWGTAVVNPQVNLTNFACGSATALSFVLSGAGSSAKIIIDDVLIPAGLTLTGRATVSDIFQIFNSESASGGTVTDCLFFSNNNIYDANLLYRNSAATGSYFMQANGDLYAGSLNVTANVAQTLQAFTYNCRANGSLVTGATATLSYSAPMFSNGTVTTASGGTATSIQLPLIAGGTNARLIASPGAVSYSTSTAMAFSAVGSAGQIFQSAGTGAPSWSTSTYPATNAINTVLYASAANVMSALATANNGAFYTGATGVPAITTLGNSKILASNSTGVIAGRSFTLKTTVFTIGGGATQVFTPQTGSLWCSVEMVGGGGGSGGTASTSVSQYAAAGGGSAGEYARGLFSTATMIGAGTTTQINLGAAGTAAAAGNNAGGNGGTTSIIANGGAGSTLMTATNGFGGSGAAANSTGISFPGLGGGNSGTGGDYHAQGGYSGVAIASALGSFAAGSAGGSSMMGSGAPGLTNAAGVAGTGAGSGASGACAYPSNAALAGAVGRAGQVVITEYIIN